MSSAEDSTVVEINVGGEVYMTTLLTLCKDQSSNLKKLVSEKKYIIKDNHGRIFLDRDGILFRYILEFLRTDCLLLPEDFNDYERLLSEVEFYNIKPLLRELTSRLQQLKVEKKQRSSFITICVRGTYAFGRDGIADIKFRKLQHILVCGNVAIAREVFNDTLNETRDPNRGENFRYTSRFFLKHVYLEKAFDQLYDAGFKIVSSAAGGAGFDPETEETKWNHFINFTFQRE